jgi:pimeloyl-ACP methyl ester carboxylesterase
MSNVAQKKILDRARPDEIAQTLESAGKLTIIRSQGCAIHWRIWGCGRPLLLLHGNFGNWTHWIRNIPALSQNFQVIAPDIPGFGDSDLPPQPYTADSIATLLNEGLAHLLSDRRIIIVGFSFGSSIAGAMARQLGSIAAMLVVVSAGHLRLRKAEIPPLISWRKLQSPDARRSAHVRNLHAMMISRLERIDDLAVHVQSENAPKRRLAADTVTATHPLRSDLLHLSCPFAGIWGRDDRTIGEHMHERLNLFSDLGRGADAHVIDDAGHWVQYEAANAFNAKLPSIISGMNAYAST